MPGEPGLCHGGNEGTTAAGGWHRGCAELHVQPMRMSGPGWSWCCKQGGYTTSHTCLTQAPQAAPTSTFLSISIPANKQGEKLIQVWGWFYFFFLSTHYLELMARSHNGRASFTHPKIGQELADIPGHSSCHL